MQPLAFLLPVLYTIFLWWFTTGVIIAVYDQSPRIIRICFVGATVVLLGALGGVYLTREMAHMSGVYLAFTCGVLLWGWQTASYYLGFVTGPKRQQDALQQDQNLLTRFWLALQSSLYHELLVAGFALLLAGLTWSYPNRWALWIFLALWGMHSSAKLNVFFGVRNFRIDFLPRHLHYLDALLEKRPYNLLFLISITAAPSVALVLLYRAVAPGTPPEQTTGLLLVMTMIILGILEHLLLVLPIPTTLWGWGMRSLSPQDNTEHTPTQQLSMRAMPEQIVKG